MPTKILISLLAVCLLVPTQLDAEEENSLVPEYGSERLVPEIEPEVAAAELAQGRRAIIAGLITPIWYSVSFIRCWVNPPLGLGPTPEPGFLERLKLSLLTAEVITIPGFGHIYARDGVGFLTSVSIWLLGWVAVGMSSHLDVTASYLLGVSIMYGALLYDTLHAPIAAKRHNEKHAKEKAESSRLTVFPTLALGKEYVGAGIGVSF